MVQCAFVFSLFSRAYSDRIQASPTLDLVNDFSRFTIGFFEVISTSATHIYHSALPLSPRTSTVHKLYGPYAHPLAKVVQGIPMSWEPVVATVRHHDRVTAAAWSPCSRYIAVSCSSPTIEILDAETLERLHAFEPRSAGGWLSFTPDSRLLTQFSHDHQEVTTWDLQTGCRISTIPPTSHIPSRCFSSTYSIDGKMVAVAYRDQSDGDTGTTGISTYTLLSGTHTYSHHVSEGCVVAPIWTHGECLRFVTVKPGTITVWQVGFTSTNTLTKVESFPAPDDVGDSKTAFFLPTRFLLAFTGIGIWDVRDSKLLLKIQIGGSNPNMTFSADGRFFVYGDYNAGIRLWEESLTGYVLRGKLVSGIRNCWRALLSPNGKSIITPTDDETRLWRTTELITSLSSVPTQPTEPVNFLLEFSSDGSLAAIARLGENMATVLDLKSGNPRLVINTGVMICGLRVTGSSIVVVGEGRIITWNLPPRDHVLDVRANIDDSVRTVMFDCPTSVFGRLRSAQISPDFDYAVTMRREGDGLDIYDMATGNHLAGTTANVGERLWITPDGREVWDLDKLSNTGWKIIKDGNSHIIGLERLPENAHPSGGYPWTPPHGHNITKDGWIFNSRKERLMWLPYHWRACKQGRKWDGGFVGLLHSELLEPIIIGLGE